MGFFRRFRALTNQTAFDAMVRDFMVGNDPKKGREISVYGEQALKFTAVFACFRVLAETFASVPVFEYRRLPDGDRKKTNDTGVFDVVHHAFNESMTAFNGKEVGMNQMSLDGNAYFEKVQTVGGSLYGLYPIPWEMVKTEVGKDYRVKYIVDGEKTKPKTRKEIFHVAGPSMDGIVGMSPISYAAQAVRLGITYEQFQVNFYQNGATPTGVFEHPGHLKDDAYTRMKSDIKTNWTGVQNAGVPMITEDGVKFNQLTMKLIDAELLSSKKFQVEDICRIYRVPLHLVQNLDKATNNNIEHQSLEFAMYTMLPHFKRWEENINTQLLTRQQRDQGYYFEFNMNALLRGDQESMAKAFAMGRQWGWLSVNDIRRLLNMNRIENGDIYLQPMNMVEAGTLPEDPKADDVRAYLQAVKAGDAPVNGKVKQEVEDLIIESGK